MSNIIITANDQVSPDLERLALLLGDLRPVMRRVERDIFQPMAASSRAQAPFKTGELRQAVKSWSGKYSAGLSIRREGKAIPKAALFLKGAKAHKFKKRESYQVTRGGTTFSRKNPGSPWGRVRRRAFFPGRNALMAQSTRIELVIAEFLRNAVEGQ